MRWTWTRLILLLLLPVSWLAAFERNIWFAWADSPAGAAELCASLLYAVHWCAVLLVCRKSVSVMRLGAAGSALTFFPVLCAAWADWLPEWLLNLALMPAFVFLMPLGGLRALCGQAMALGLLFAALALVWLCASLFFLHRAGRNGKREL